MTQGHIGEDFYAGGEVFVVGGSLFLGVGGVREDIEKGVVHGVEVEEVRVGGVREDEKGPVDGDAQEDIHAVDCFGFEFRHKLLEIFEGFFTILYVVFNYPNFY